MSVYTARKSATSGWFHKPLILNNFRIGHRHLQEMVSKGYIRTVKLDSRQQGRRLYCSADIESTLIALSEGREPKRVAGRGGER